MGVRFTNSHLVNSKSRPQPLITSENGQTYFDHLLIMDADHPWAKTYWQWAKIKRSIKRFRAKYLGYQGCECH